MVAGASVQSTSVPTPQPLPQHGPSSGPAVSHPIIFELTGGFVLALVLVILAFRAARARNEKNGWVIPAAATWSLPDSWATNLTAILTTVAAVGGALADKFPDVVAERSVLEYGVGGVILAVIAALAPVAYGALAQDPVAQLDKDDAERAAAAKRSLNKANRKHEVKAVRSGDLPSTWMAKCPLALLLSAVLTLTGTFGSLVGGVVLAEGALLTDHTRWLTRFLFGIAFALVATYAYRTIVWVLSATQATGGVTSTKPKRLAGLFVVSCCGGDGESTRVRTALL